MINNSCVTCPTWATWNGAKCVLKSNYNCDYGQIFVNGQCIYASY